MTIPSAFWKRAKFPYEIMELPLSISGYPESTIYSKTTEKSLNPVTMDWRSNRTELALSWNVATKPCHVSLGKSSLRKQTLNATLYSVFCWWCLETMRVENMVNFLKRITIRPACSIGWLNQKSSKLIHISSSLKKNGKN